MPAFMFIGGQEFDDTDLPAAVSMFGHKFIQEVPKVIERDKFKSQDEYDHAIMKLSQHPHFQKLEDDVQEVIQQPKKRGRKPKLEVDAEDAIVEDIVNGDNHQ